MTNFLKGGIILNIWIFSGCVSTYSFVDMNLRTPLISNKELPTSGKFKAISKPIMRKYCMGKDSGKRTDKESMWVGAVDELINQAIKETNADALAKASFVHKSGEHDWCVSMKATPVTLNSGVATKKTDTKSNEPKSEDDALLDE